jgi:hypothetical protein
MKVTEQELRFIKDTCEFMTDDRIAFEINRIRKELSESDMVTAFRVGKERRKMGLKKTQGGYGFLPKDSDK